MLTLTELGHDATLPHFLLLGPFRHIATSTIVDFTFAVNAELHVLLYYFGVAVFQAGLADPLPVTHKSCLHK